VSSHAVRVVTVVGVLAGVSIAGFFANHGLPTLVIAVGGVALIAFAEGAFLTWRDSEEARDACALRREDEIRASLLALRSIMVELSYIESRVEEGPLGDELLPNFEWLRHKDRIAAERGDVFVELGRAYREADWLNRTRDAMETMDEDEVEYAVGKVLESIRDAFDILGEWENELMRAEASVASLVSRSRDRSETSALRS
jgi:hypothetical protein